MIIRRLALYTYETKWSRKPQTIIGLLEKDLGSNCLLLFRLKYYYHVNFFAIYTKFRRPQGFIEKKKKKNKKD